MPFTPAHSAIVLPFIRSGYFSATGLVIGSLAPDFEYFFKMSVSSDHSHTLAGILYFDIPVVFFLAFLFHVVAKRNFIGNLPAFLQKRFLDTLYLDFPAHLREHWMIFLLSAGLGSASHIFWDGFTHASGYFVRIFPSLSSVVIPYDGARYPLFYALQHISTVIGLVVVLIYVIGRAPHAGPLTRPSLLYWGGIVVITALSVVIRFSILAPDRFIGTKVVTVISGFCLALVIMGFFNFRKATPNYHHG